MKIPQLITCTGYGGTGSSVISDLLKEYESVKSMGDFEFSLAHEVDGISDLQHYYVDDFNRLKTTEGIYRFQKLVKSIRKHYSPFFNNRFASIINEYLNSIIEVEWKGFWHQHIRRTPFIPRFFTYLMPNKIWELIRRICSNKDYELPVKMRKQTMCLGYGRDRFFRATVNLYDNLTYELTKDTDAKYLVMDQLVPPYSTDRYLKYFSNLKIIIIDRDPRDLYLLNKLFWNEGWIPSSDVDTFISWFRLIRQHRIYEKDTDNVLYVRFEDFIYNYDLSIEKVENFLGLDCKLHKEPQKYFNPERSKKNVQLWDKFKKYDDDIQKIYSELKEYCYEF